MEHPGVPFTPKSWLLPGICSWGSEHFPASTALPAQGLCPALAPSSGGLMSQQGVRYPQLRPPALMGTLPASIFIISDQKWEQLRAFWVVAPPPRVFRLCSGHTAPEALLNEPTERSTDISTILCHWTNKGKKVHSSLLRRAGGVECHQQSPLLITCQAQLLQPSWEQESLSTWAHSSHKHGSFAMSSFAHRA